MGYTKGGITEAGRKNLLRCVDYLAYISERQRVFNPVREKWHDFQLAFITLTIPVFLPEDQHKQFKAKVFSRFMQDAVRRGYIGLYVYVNELTKKGNLHFHVMSNRFVHFARVRDLWNKHLKLSGYLNNYFDNEGHWDANSTDVKCVVGTDQASQYIAKYMSKGSDERGGIQGRLWDASEKLKGLKYYTTFLEDRHRDEVYSLFTDRQEDVFFKDNIYFLRAKLEDYKTLLPDAYLQGSERYWQDIRVSL